MWLNRAWSCCIHKLFAWHSYSLHVRLHDLPKFLTLKSETHLIISYQFLNRLCGKGLCNVRVFATLCNSTTTYNIILQHSSLNLCKTPVVEPICMKWQNLFMTSISFISGNYNIIDSAWFIQEIIKKKRISGAILRHTKKLSIDWEELLGFSNYLRNQYKI